MHHDCLRPEIYDLVEGILASARGSRPESFGPAPKAFDSLDHAIVEFEAEVRADDSRDQGRLLLNQLSSKAVDAPAENRAWFLALAGVVARRIGEFHDANRLRDEAIDFAGQFAETGARVIRTLEVLDILKETEAAEVLEVPLARASDWIRRCDDPLETFDLATRLSRLLEALHRTSESETFARLARESAGLETFPKPALATERNDT